MRDDRAAWRNALIALGAAALCVAGLAIIVYVGVARDRLAPTPTPTPTPGLVAAIATPPGTAQTPLASVVGVVQDYEPGALIIVIAPRDGNVDQVIVPENLQVSWLDGTRASPMQIAVGQVLYAEGEMDPLGRLVARRIILTPVEATATPTIPPLPSPTASATGVPIAVGEWRGEYYDNVELSGPPPLVRGDSVLDFRWGEGPPAPGLPADGFSARWRGRWAFDEGGYRFYAYADNGIRVWVDDRLVIDTWRDQEPTLTTADVYLEAGQRDLRVDYYHRRDEAIVRVWWDYRGLYPDWKGEYFSNPDLVGEPTVIRNDSELRFDWGPRSPAAGIPADRFGVRWTRTVQFEEGAYRFFARADDGVRVWVDQALVVDEWHESTPRTYVEHLWVDSGPRTVRVEFYENGGNAHIHVWWERIERFDHWMGAYYANPDAAGRPVFLRDDERLDFDWGEGSPGQGIPVDNFSARWTRTLAFEGGPYRFSASADDGVRLYVDGKLLIDQWREPAAGRHTADVTLSQGMHTIVVEYYDRAGNARLQIGWEALPTPTPTSTGAGTPESPTATATETPYPSPPATIPASSAG